MKKCLKCGKEFNPQNSPYENHGPTCGKKAEGDINNSKIKMELESLLGSHSSRTLVDALINENIDENDMFFFSDLAFKYPDVEIKQDTIDRYVDIVKNKPKCEIPDFPLTFIKAKVFLSFVRESNLKNGKHIEDVTDEQWNGFKDIVKGSLLDVYTVDMENCEMIMINDWEDLSETLITLFREDAMKETKEWTDGVWENNIATFKEEDIDNAFDKTLSFQDNVDAHYESLTVNGLEINKIKKITHI